MYIRKLIKYTKEKPPNRVHRLPGLSMLLIAWLSFGLFDVKLSQADIVNGSFELPVVTPGSFQNFTGGSTAINGWTVVGVESAVVSESFTNNQIIFNAYDGNQWLDLTGATSSNPNSGVRQSIATTIGQTYRVSFYVGSVEDGGNFHPSTVALSIDGGSRQNFFNPNTPRFNLDWMNFNVDFLATSSSTSLTFLNGSSANNALCALDGVSVTAIPEPSTPILLVLLSTAIVSRRRKNRS